jgi:hypothetical protein
MQLAYSQLLKHGHSAPLFFGISISGRINTHQAVLSVTTTGVRSKAALLIVTISCHLIGVRMTNSTCMYPYPVRGKVRRWCDISRRVQAPASRAISRVAAPTCDPGVGRPVMDLADLQGPDAQIISDWWGPEAMLA